MNLFTPKEGEIACRAKGSRRGNCVEIGGGLIRSGEKVECCREASPRDGDGAAVLCIGEVIATDDRRDVRKSELPKCHLARGSAKERPVLLRKLVAAPSEKKRDFSRHSNAPETPSEMEFARQFEWVRATAVTGMAFVFHLDAMQDGKCLCGGIMNVHCIRDQINDEDKK